MPSPTDAPISLPERLADAEGELPTRLRIIADGDLRTMARDSLVGIHPDQHELHEWADLMDEAADALTAAESAREAAVALAERAERDAARFRALMRCGRIKPQGSAGVNTKTGERTYPDEPGSVHFGAEFWVQPEAEPSNMTIWGRHCLHALADDILAYEAAALAHPATAEET